MSAATAQVARWRVPFPLAVAFCLFTLLGIVALLPPMREPAGHVIVTREIRVVLQPDGSSVIDDAANGEVIGHVPAAGPSFARGLFHSMRGFRRLHRAAVDGPYRLSMMSDGRLLLRDPSTSTAIDIEGFGAGNASKFTAWLGLPPMRGPGR